MALIYALANHIHSFCSSLLTFILAEMSELFSGFTKTVCVNGTAKDIEMHFFPLETNSIQNQRITEW